MFDLLLKYAASEDGSLHAEKYYHTVREEFAVARPAFKQRLLLETNSGDRLESKGHCRR